MTINSRSVVIGIVFVCFLLVKCDIVIELTKVNCIVHDPITIQNVSCSLKLLNRTARLLNMSGNIVRQIDKLFVRRILYPTYLFDYPGIFWSNKCINSQLYKRTVINYRPFLVNTTDNYCEFFARNRASTYLRLFAPIYLSSSNLNHSCPYYGQVLVKDLLLNEDKMPTNWLLGTYRLDMLAFEEVRNIITIQLFGIVKEKF